MRISHEDISSLLLQRLLLLLECFIDLERGGGFAPQDELCVSGDSGSSLRFSLDSNRFILGIDGLLLHVFCVLFLG
jgi:hypothetical protein